MLASIPQVAVQQANLQTVDVGQVKVGPISVGDLVVNNADVTLSQATGSLQDVSVTIRIQVSFEWSIHVGMPDWIPDINEGDTYDLGALEFGPLSVGDISLPSLADIHLTVPALSAAGVSVDVDPMALRATNARAEGISAGNVTLPADGFALTGLGLGSLQATDIAVPAARIDSATVNRVQGDAITLPALTLANLSAPTVSVPSISTAAPVDIPATLATRSLGFDAGILRAAIHLTPSATSHIERLEINNAQASATVNRVVASNVTLPYEVLNLTLSQVGIQTVTIPALNVS